MISSYILGIVIGFGIGFSAAMAINSRNKKYESDNKSS